MADNFRFAQLQPFSLAGSGAVAGATSVTLKSMLDIDGNALTMAGTFGAIGFGTIEPGNSDLEEQICFTGLTNNANGTTTLTGVSNVSFTYPYTQTSGLSKTHAGSTTFVISNTSGYYDKFAAKNDDETIAGTWTFTAVPASTADAVSGDDLPNYDQVLALINGGAVSHDRNVVAGTAGETVSKDQLVYLKASDGRWWLCDADTAATVDNVTLGLAQGAGTAGVAISGGVLTYGLATLTAFTVTAATKYYASNTAGGISTSAGTTEVTVGLVPSGSTTTILFFPRYDQQVTENELDAMAGGSTFGTPSANNKFITQDYNSSATGLPVVRVYTSSDTWTKPAGLKYVMVEVVGGGGGGGGNTTVNNGANGGGGGGYSRERIAVATLGATETVTIGAAGAAGLGSGGAGGAGGTTSFGSLLQATGGAGGAVSPTAAAAAGGVGSGGDVNLTGEVGGLGNVTAGVNSGKGGDSQYGHGGPGVYENSDGNGVGRDGNGYGGGGSGAKSDGNDKAGGAGTAGIVIVAEYYS